MEQETYEAEGIDWAHVDFEDNQVCVDLLEARPPKGTGILSLLDEECLFPRVRIQRLIIDRNPCDLSRAFSGASLCKERSSATMMSWCQTEQEGDWELPCSWGWE